MGEICHDSLSAGDCTAITMDNNNVVGHKASELLDIASFNRCCPAECDLSNLVHIRVGGSVFHASLSLLPNY